MTNSGAHPKPLAHYPVHLGLGAVALTEPRFGGANWYGTYENRHSGDGIERRLVSLFTFEASRDMWEMHPAGDEVVLCTAGAMTVLQENADGTARRVPLAEGGYVINLAGVWHTADVVGTATALFITAGSGTQHRPRDAQTN